MKKLILSSLIISLGLTLSACGSTSETSSNPTETKLQAIEEIIELGDANIMGQVYTELPDLSLIRAAGPEESYSITRSSVEDWLYSKEHRLTVIMWNDRNAPIHVFSGNSLSLNSIQEIREKRADLLGQ